MLEKEHIYALRKTAYVDISVGLLLVPFSFMLFSSAEEHPIINDVVQLILMFSILVAFIFSRTLFIYRVYFVVHESKGMLPILWNFITICFLLLYVRASLTGLEDAIYYILIFCVSMVVDMILSYPTFDAVAKVSGKLALAYIVSYAVVACLGLIIANLIFNYATASDVIYNKELYKYIVYLLTSITILSESFLADYICKEILKGDS